MMRHTNTETLRQRLAAAEVAALETPSALREELAAVEREGAEEERLAAVAKLKKELALLHEGDSAIVAAYVQALRGLVGPAAAGLEHSRQITVLKNRIAVMEHDMPLNFWRPEDGWPILPDPGVLVSPDPDAALRAWVKRVYGETAMR